MFSGKMVLTLAALAQMGFATSFYDASVENHQRIKEIRAKKGDGNDSERLQTLIDKVASRSGGGIIRMERGEYFLAGIQLKSNVHLYIDAGAVIRPYCEQTRKSVGIFHIGGTGKNCMENISVQGVGGRFSIEMVDHKPGLRGFMMRNVTNFKIANVDIFEQQTKYSCVGFYTSGDSAETGAYASKGTVENASAYNCDYGYGLVQAHAAESVLFQNLYSKGGVTLRLETGAKKMNDAQFGGVFNIAGRNLSGSDGKCVVNLSPHSMHNGAVYIDGVTATNCGFAVQVGGGFISKKQSNKSITDGTFGDGSYVRNVQAVFGTTAQLKRKHFKYIPKKLDKYIQKPAVGEKWVIGPAIAAVINYANYDIDVQNVTAKGFKYHPPVITPKDARDLKAEMNRKSWVGRFVGLFSS